MGHKKGTESSMEGLRPSFLRDETAQDLVEYTLLAALLAAGAIVAWNYILGSSIQTIYYVIVQKLDNLFFGVTW